MRVISINDKPRRINMIPRIVDTPGRRGVPNRILREGINSSARINALSMGAEILYRRLMSAADDYGRFYAEPAAVRGACWPTAPNKVSELEVSEWLLELVSGECPLVRFYSHNGCRYLVITEFGQRIRYGSKFPEPNLSNSNGMNGAVFSPPSADFSPPTRARTPTPTPSYSSSLGSAETLSSGAPIPRPKLTVSEPQWKRDELFMEFVELYRKTGAALIDQDFAEAHRWAWSILDFEQKQARMKSIQERVSAKYYEPQFVPKPRKFIDHEWGRAMISRKNGTNGLPVEEPDYDKF